MSNESTAYIISIDETPREIFLEKLPSFEQFLAVLNAELGLDVVFTPAQSVKEIVRVSTTDHEAPEDHILNVIQEHPMTLWSAYEKLIQNHNIMIELEEDTWWDLTLDIFKPVIGEITNKPLVEKKGD